MAGKLIIDNAFLALLETLSLYIRTTMNGRLGGAHRSRATGSSTDFYDHQLYQPGDDLRRMDWNLVARSGQYYVKRYVAERQHQTNVYLDISASMGAQADKARMALQLAAAVGYLSVQALDRVSYRLLTGEKCRDLCGVLGGREAFYRAAEQLATLDFSGETNLGAALRADPSPGFDDGLSIVISDFFTDSDWQGAVKRLLSQRREVMLIALYAPEEFAPAYSGPLSLVDCEAPAGHGLTLQIDRSTHIAYRQAVAFFRAELAAFCASNGVTLIQAGSDERIEQIILQKGMVA